MQKQTYKNNDERIYEDQVEGRNSVIELLESGKDIKKTEAVEKWKNVCLDEENLDFYNAYFGIKYDNENIILNVDYDTYNREQKMLFAQIENMLSNMYKYYSEELKTINKQLNAFAQNRIKEEHKVKFLQIYNDT